jgi:hypothetical protein
MNAPAAGVAEADGTKAAAADRRQAEYFRRVLQDRYSELCDKIASDQRLLIKCQNRDEPSEASRMRRSLRDAERERKTVRRLIGAIDARFFTDAPIDGAASG